MCLENPDHQTSILLKQAYQPYYVTGQTESVSAVAFESVANVANQKVDALLYYDCDDTWFVLTKTDFTVYDTSPDGTEEFDWAMLEVDDTSTCSFARDWQTDANSYTRGMIHEMIIQYETDYTDYDEDSEFDLETGEPIWSRLRMVVFSMIVSGSLLASYSPTTFYVLVTYSCSTLLRTSVFVFDVFMSWHYEIVHPDPVIALCEACYMGRHEEDLKLEEESYRMIQEIMRCPDFFKQISGSCLKGATDPKLDKLSKENVKKLEHLDKLDTKGFEVERLKRKVLGDYSMHGDLIDTRTSRFNF